MPVVFATAFLTFLSAVWGQARAAVDKMSADYVVAGEVGEAIGGASVCGYTLNMDAVNVWTEVHIYNMSIDAVHHFQNALYGAGGLSSAGGEADPQCQRRSQLAIKYRLVE